MYFEHAPIRCSDHIIVLQPDQSRFLVLKSIIFYWIIWIDMWLCLNNCHQVLIFRRGSISHISHHPLSCFQLIILPEPVIFTHPPATCVVISTKIMETMVIFKRVIIIIIILTFHKNGLMWKWKPVKIWTITWRLVVSIWLWLEELT